MRYNNPFSLSFGKEPDRYVKRIDAYNKITENFDSISPSSNCFVIMGVRGSGKTVLMSTVSNEYRNNSDWIVVSLNPGRNLMEMLAARLYEDASLQRCFMDAELNLSKFGIGLNIKKNPPISDIQIAIEKMIEIVNDKGKKILITIDDITKNDSVVSFANAFQTWTSQNMNVYLLMTGLYENVYNLQRDKRCSFLLRAEKVLMTPLNLIGMKAQYQQTFQCDENEALQMAKFTKGYSYAFQVLGYIMWENECSIEEAIPEFDERMAEYCYEKIWDDLSEREKEIIVLLAKNGNMKTKDIIEKINSNPQVYSVQRMRLIKKGVLESRERGQIGLSLPRFDKYVLIRNEVNF